MANNHCTLCEQVECPRHFHRQADASRRQLLPTGHNLKAKGHNDVPFRVNMQPTMAPLSHRHADHTHARPTSHTTHTETGASSSWPHTHPHTHYTHNGFRTFSTVKSSTSLTQLTPLRTTTQTPYSQHHFITPLPVPRTMERMSHSMATPTHPLNAV